MKGTIKDPVYTLGKGSHPMPDIAITTSGSTAVEAVSGNVRAG